VYDETELNRLNEQLLQKLNDSGKILLTQTRLDGKYTLRLVAGQVDTCLEDVRKGWALVCETAAGLGA
jgi:aromatic-L-amino-acid decarboxylase